MRVLVLGSGYAGLSSALGLARRLGKRDQVILVDGTDRFLERIRLHERAAGRRGAERSLPRFLAGTGVRFEQGWIGRIDLAAKVVHVGARSVPYDRLVVALGSTTPGDAVPGQQEHALTLSARCIETVGERVSALAAAGGEVTVVGAGLTGVEAASELAERFPGLGVRLLSSDALLPGFARKARAHAHSVLSRLSVRVQLGVHVHRLTKGGLDTSLGHIASDLVLWCAGFRAPRLVSEAGFAVNELGQALVDDRLRSISHPDVFVVGDAAALDARFGAGWPMGCKSALPMASYVVHALPACIRGARVKPFGFQLYGFCVSLGRREAFVQLGKVEPARLVTGSVATRLKELVCRSTLWFLELSRLRAKLARMLRTEPQLAGTNEPELGA